MPGSLNAVMKFTALLPLLSWAATAAVMQPKQLSVDDMTSIRNVAATIAYDTMAYYKGNISDDPNAVGNVEPPYYWWVGGALWGTMLDYYHVTQDPSYNKVVLDALLAKVNLGPQSNYLSPEHAHEEGNDDLFFWGNAALTAAENNFPQPNETLPSWLDISKNVFDWLQAQWNTTECNGGIFWQILPSNPNGVHYKNTITNGGFFQFAARLARATGDPSYLSWAETVWDWTWDMHLIDHDNYHVYDGVDILTQCRKVNHNAYTYLSGVYLYGAAVMANYTGNPEWADRAEKLLSGSSWFFGAHNDNSYQRNILYEGACEQLDSSCLGGKADMSTLKGYLVQQMWKSTVMMPSLKPRVASWLVPTAQAAALSCQGGHSGTQCGMKWSTGGFDNFTNLGPQMNALAAVQGLLINTAPAPRQGSEIIRVLDANFKPLDPAGVYGNSNSSTTLAPATNSRIFIRRFKPLSF